MTKVELIVPLIARDGKLDELRKELQSLLAPTHAEPGSEFYRLYESETKGHFFFHERWASQEALDEHMKSPHFKHFEKLTGSLLAKPLEINKVKEVS